MRKFSSLRMQLRVKTGSRENILARLSRRSKTGLSTSYFFDLWKTVCKSDKLGIYDRLCPGLLARNSNLLARTVTVHAFMLHHHGPGIYAVCRLMHVIGNRTSQVRETRPETVSRTLLATCAEVSTTAKWNAKASCKSVIWEQFGFLVEERHLWILQNPVGWRNKTWDQTLSPCTV